MSITVRLVLLGAPFISAIVAGIFLSAAEENKDED